MRKILAALAVAAVAVTPVAAPPTYTLAANVLTMTGYTAGGLIDLDMRKILKGDYCSPESGHTCKSVDYLAGMPGELAEPAGLLALRWVIATTPSPKTVVAFSQGATISTHWLQQDAKSIFAPKSEDLRFVLLANPLRKWGGIRSDIGYRPTPDSTQYQILDIAVEYDGVADFPDNPFNLLAVANALAGAQYIHIYGYNDIDIAAAEKLIWKEGNTTYVLVRSANLPLLEPLRRMGLTELADDLDSRLRPIIDSAYNRSYPNLVDPSQHSAVLAPFNPVWSEVGSPEATNAAARATSVTLRTDVSESVPDSLPAPDDLPVPDDSADPVDVETGSGSGEPDEATDIGDTLDDTPADTDTPVDDDTHVDEDTPVTDDSDDTDTDGSDDRDAAESDSGSSSGSAESSDKDDSGD